MAIEWVVPNQWAHVHVIAKATPPPLPSGQHEKNHNQPSHQHQQQQQQQPAPHLHPQLQTRPLVIPKWGSLHQPLVFPILSNDSSKRGTTRKTAQPHERNHHDGEISSSFCFCFCETCTVYCTFIRVSWACVAYDAASDLHACFVLRNWSASINVIGYVSGFQSIFCFSDLMPDVILSNTAHHKTSLMTATKTC